MLHWFNHRHWNDARSLDLICQNWLPAIVQLMLLKVYLNMLYWKHFVLVSIIKSQFSRRYCLAAGLGRYLSNAFHCVFICLLINNEYSKMDYKVSKFMSRVLFTCAGQNSKYQYGRQIWCLMYLFSCFSIVWCRSYAKNKDSQKIT